MQVSVPTHPTHTQGGFCTRRAQPRHSQPLLSQHLSRRGAWPTCRFKQSQSDAAEIPLRLRQSTAGRKQPVDPAIPQPQEVQASVMLVPKEQAASQQVLATDSPLNSFLVKCRLAWNLFFPSSESSGATRQLSPKELGKQRLSMILVADKCGLSPNSLVEMKRNTLAALQDCMDLEDLQDAALRFTMTRENGVTYSMAVPILRPDPYTQEAGSQEPFSATASWEDGLEGEAAYGEYSFEEEEEEGGEEAGEFEEAAGLEEGAQGDLGSWKQGGNAGPDAAAAPAGDAYAAAAAEAQLRAQAASPTAAGPGQALFGAQGRGSKATSPASSRAASRAGRSPVPAEALQQQGQQVQGSSASSELMTPGQLRELLVEELVHDVEELVEQLGPQAGVQAVEVSHGEVLITPAAAGGAEGDSGAAAAAAADVLAEQLEAAVAEVQHFGEGGAQPHTEA